MKEKMNIHNYQFIETFLLDLKKYIHYENFSGIGIIFYKDLSNLSMVSLGSENTYPLHLPLCNYEMVLESLASLSQLSSEWHDGFHLYDLGSSCLTHISQFISPNVDLYKGNHTDKPLGARQMSAIISSMIVGISGVGLLTRNKMAIYESGNCVKEITYEF